MILQLSEFFLLLKNSLTDQKFTIILILLIINTSLLVILIIFIIFKLRNNKKLTDNLRSKLQFSQDQNKNLQLSLNNLSSFKHDFPNILQTINGFIKLKDFIQLEDYFNNLLHDYKINNPVMLLNPSLINNSSLYCLFSNKYFYAKNQNVLMNFYIEDNLENLNLKIYELTRILGILLDNAVEAAKNTQEKNININISYKTNKYIFQIQNSYENKSVDTEKIFEKGYTTKHNSDGIGLWNVHTILQKNEELDLYTSKDENYFTQTLYLYQ